MPYAPLSSILLASVYLHTPSRHQSCGDLSLYIFNLSKPFYKACQLIMIIILENSLSLQFSWQKQVNVSTVYCLLNPLYLQGSQSQVTGGLGKQFLSIAASIGHEDAGLLGKINPVFLKDGKQESETRSFFAFWAIVESFLFVVLGPFAYKFLVS